VTSQDEARSGSAIVMIKLEDLCLPAATTANLAITMNKGQHNFTLSQVCTDGKGEGSLGRDSLTVKFEGRVVPSFLPYSQNQTYLLRIGESEDVISASLLLRKDGQAVFVGTYKGQTDLRGTLGGNWSQTQ